MKTAYQMAITNIVQQIKINAQLPYEDREDINAFDASSYIGMAFAKSKEDVIADIFKETK